MSFTISIDATAAKMLTKLDPPTAARMHTAIGLLADHPRPPAAIPLRGSPFWRLRVGDYRIIYAIGDAEPTILILDIGHRREIYR